MIETCGSSSLRTTKQFEVPFAQYVTVYFVLCVVFRRALVPFNYDPSKVSPRREAVQVDMDKPRSKPGRS